MLENFRLRVFRSAAGRLSFSRAGEELLLTQPAVTQQIRALEDELGAALFDRGGGRIQLTAAGAALLPFAERLRVLGEEAAAAVAAAAGGRAGAGELTLAASQTIGQYLLPRWIAGFLREHPRIAVSVRGGNTDGVLQAVVAREAALGLIEGPPRRTDVQVEPFFRDEMALLVPAGHPWAGKEVPLPALAGEPLLFREFGSGSRRIVEQALAAAGIKLRELRVRMEFDSTEGLLTGVEAGLGAAFASRWAAGNRLALGTLRRARVPGLALGREFALAYPAGPPPAGNGALFRAFLLDPCLREESGTEGGAPGV